MVSSCSMHTCSRTVCVEQSSGEVEVGLEHREDLEVSEPHLHALFVWQGGFSSYYH